MIWLVKVDEKYEFRQNLQNRSTSIFFKNFFYNAENLKFTGFISHDFNCLCEFL